MTRLISGFGELDKLVLKDLDDFFQLTLRKYFTKLYLFIIGLEAHTHVNVLHWLIFRLENVEYSFEYISETSYKTSRGHRSSIDSEANCMMIYLKRFLAYLWNVQN